MTITFDPDALIKKYATPSKIKRLITNDLKINKTMLKVFAQMEFISEKELENIVLKALQTYKKKFSILKKNMAPVSAIRETLNQKAMLVNRLQGAVIMQITEEVKENYLGEFYIWLPSSAGNPDPEHQLNYGKKFQIGIGEMPGERFGCKCGMQILVDEQRLQL